MFFTPLAAVVFAAVYLGYGLFSPMAGPVSFIFTLS